MSWCYDQVVGGTAVLFVVAALAEEAMFRATHYKHSRVRISRG